MDSRADLNSNQEMLDSYRIKLPIYPPWPGGGVGTYSDEDYSESPLFQILVRRSSCCSSLSPSCAYSSFPNIFLQELVRDEKFLEWVFLNTPLLRELLLVNDVAVFPYISSIWSINTKG